MTTVKEARMTTLFKALSVRVVAGVVVLALAAVGPARGQVSVVNMTPKFLSGEHNQDSEVNLAVNPQNTSQIAASAFTPDPAGGPNAPIYISADGGKTWTLNSILPSQVTTADI